MKKVIDPIEFNESNCSELSGIQALAEINRIIAEGGVKSFGGALLFGALCARVKFAGMSHRLPEYAKNFKVGTVYAEKDYKALQKARAAGIR